MMHDLIGKNASGGDIVAVAEASGKRHKLEIRQLLRLFEQPVDMQETDSCPGQFKGMGGFLVAIRAGSTNDEGMRLHDSVERYEDCGEESTESRGL